MALVPITIYGAVFTSSEIAFLTNLADHSYTDGQLAIGNSLTGGISFSTLTAGSNITITNGHGTITIAGASGLTQLSTASTVDGTNTVFVFPSQPTYVVSDGTWYTATDNNGNTQWTWSAGLKTVTMTVPPTTEIWGF